MNRVNSHRLKNCLETNTETTLLSPYLTAGYPDKMLTVELMHKMVDAGADIIELGIPFSEPMAEGVVIQQAMEKALNNGTQLSDVLACVKHFREENQNTPVILMGYLNTIEQLGYENFAQQAYQVGVDGTIIVDLPPEEAGNLFDIWADNQLDQILLCSPTTSEQRMELISQKATGYVYYVSLKGVTGAQSLDVSEVSHQYQKRKQALGGLPLLVGFGIKTPEHAAALAPFADGIVIGAALIEKISKPETALDSCYNFLHPIKKQLTNS